MTAVTSTPSISHTTSSPATCLLVFFTASFCLFHSSPPGAISLLLLASASPNIDENLEAIITRIEQKSRKIEALLVRTNYQQLEANHQDLPSPVLDHLRTEWLMNIPSFVEHIEGSEVLCLLDAGTCWHGSWKGPDALRPPTELPWYDTACSRCRDPARTLVVALSPDAAPKLII
jgi:hypothetical protein